MEEKYVDFFDTTFDINAPQSPIQPVELNLDDEIRFRCHNQVACFNACCKNIDIVLTPYDILRLKRRLGVDSDQFLMHYAVPYAMDHHGLMGYKMRTKDNSAECQFMTAEGCSVYEDRPAACRYYPAGAMSLRRKDEATVVDAFFLVHESHCLGHDEPRRLSIRDYRKEQGVDVYDEFNKAWRDVILKKRSSGPTVGKPSERSLQLFQMCSYELDHFRRFINSESFKNTFDLDEAVYETLNSDDEALLSFAMRYMKQALFGEQTIALQERALDYRRAKARERLKARNAAETAKADQAQKARDDFYDEAREEEG